MDAQQQLQNDANPSVGTDRAASGPDPVDAECFTVVTYNILSSALASPDWFRNCDPRDLEADTRLQRVLHKLGAQVEKRAIICLQEVSRGWSGKLHAFFQQRNYTFIDSLYGAQVSGYMGVGLAFPNERWRAADIDIQRIADTKDAWIVPEREKVWRPSSSESRVGDWTCPSCGAHVFATKVACYRCHAPKPEVVPETNGAALGAPLGAPLGAGPLGGALSSLWDWLRARCGAGAIGVSGSSGAAAAASSSLEHDEELARALQAEEYDRGVGKPRRGVASNGAAEVPAWYDAARRKENTMVAVHLSSTSHELVRLWCATYHMPCAFDQPKLMAMHAAMAMQHLQRLAAPMSVPCILGGDWNLKPADHVYALLTTGAMPAAAASDDAYPAPCPEGDTWQPDLCCPMRSAYHVAHGHEPEFTNFAQSMKDSVPFIDCLDYVFISPHVAVRSVPALPGREEVSGPFPTALEPSDHLLLSVDLALPALPDGSHATAYATPLSVAPGGDALPMGREVGYLDHISAISRDALPMGREGGGCERGGRGGGGVRGGERAAASAAQDAQLEAARRAQLTAFLQRPADKSLSFPPTLNSFERRLVHSLAEELGLLHMSEGEGRGRYIRVEKKPPPPFSGEGHRLASESDQSAAAAEGEAAPVVANVAAMTAEEMRAARLAALEKRP